MWFLTAYILVQLVCFNVFSYEITKVLEIMSYLEKRVKEIIPTLWVWCPWKTHNGCVEFIVAGEDPDGFSHKIRSDFVGSNVILKDNHNLRHPFGWNSRILSCKRTNNYSTFNDVHFFSPLARTNDVATSVMCMYFLAAHLIH